MGGIDAKKTIYDGAAVPDSLQTLWKRGDEGPLRGIHLEYVGPV